MSAPRDLLLEASLAEIGIVVEVPTAADVERLRQRLYVAKREDPAYANLSFLVSPEADNQLWIVKKEDPDASS